ncbi:MAG: hypothetical protein JRJ48_02555 [Deltaproteobacteria bacterium]|nr:hypothetical protein [Deltaproteobacteria bacterium]
MEPQKIAKQMIAFNKTALDNSFDAMVALQQQAEKMVAMSLAQTAWLPEPGKAAFSEWLAACKRGRDDFKKAMDENFKKAEALFAK